MFYVRLSILSAWWLYIHIYIDLLFHRLVTPYLRGSGKKAEQTARWIGTPLKFVDSFLLFGVGFRAFRDSFFEKVSVDFGLWELAWEPVGQQDLNMCDKVAKMTFWGRLGIHSRAPRGSGRAKVASDRAAGGSGQSFRGLLSDFTTKVAISWNVWKTTGKQIIFQGLERVWAPKLEALGSQSHAREGSGQPKWPRKAPQVGSDHQTLGRSG